MGLWQKGPSGIWVVVFALLISTGILAITPEPAYACECNVDSPRARLDRADAAFVGALIEKPEEGSSGGDGLFVFSVEQAVKGDLPDVIQVRSMLSGASCGFELLIGLRAGVFLREEDGEWVSGRCSQIDADELLAAAVPFPEPDGAGPIAAIVGVSGAGVRTIALDAEGRTLAYGTGTGRVKAYAVCPESRTLVEFASAIRNNQRVSLLAVRDLRGFHVMREIDDPLLPVRILALACLDPEGDEVLVFSPQGSGGSGPARLLRVTGTDVEIVREFWEQNECSDEGVALDGLNGLVYFNAGPDCRGIYRYDLSDDRVEEIAHIPDDILVYRITDLAFNSDGRYLAVEGRHHAKVFRILMVDLAASPIEIVEEGFGDAFERHANLWLPGDRYLLAGTTQAPDTALILSATLEQVGSIEGLPGGLAVARGDAIYLVDAEGRLWTAPAGGGTARELREFDDPAVDALIAIETPVTYDASVSRPDNLAASVDPTPDAPGVAQVDNLTDTVNPAPEATDGSTDVPNWALVGGAGILVILIGGVLLMLTGNLRRFSTKRADSG